MKRRAFIFQSAGAGAFALLPGLLTASSRPQIDQDWRLADRIVESIVPPVIPDRDFDIRTIISAFYVF